MIDNSIRKHRYRLFLALFVLLLILIILPFPQEKALACSCVGGDAKQKESRSSAVFLGRIVDIGGRIKGGVGQLRKYTFEVETTWKGELNKRTTVYSLDGAEASCGYRFKQNGSYLVYSYLSKEGLLQTNLCSGNIAQAEAASELLVLGPGTTVTEKIFITNADSKTSISIFIYFVLGMIIIAGIIIALLIKRKRKEFD